MLLFFQYSQSWFGRLLMISVIEMRQRCGSNKWLLSGGQPTWGLRCSFPPRLRRQKVKPSLHSIREQASWWEDAGGSSREQKPSWSSTSLRRAAELQIPRILSSVHLAVMKMRGCFPKARVEEGGWWWGSVRPATSTCFLVEFACAAEPLITDKSSSLATISLPLIGFPPHRRVVLASGHRTAEVKLWAYTWFLSLSGLFWSNWCSCHLGGAEPAVKTTPACYHLMKL